MKAVHLRVPPVRHIVRHFQLCWRKNSRESSFSVARESWRGAKRDGHKLPRYNNPPLGFLLDENVSQRQFSARCLKYHCRRAKWQAHLSIGFRSDHTNKCITERESRPIVEPCTAGAPSGSSHNPRAMLLGREPCEHTNLTETSAGHTPCYAVSVR